MLALSSSHTSRLPNQRRANGQLYGLQLEMFRITGSNATDINLVMASAFVRSKPTAAAAYTATKHLPIWQASPDPYFEPKPNELNYFSRPTRV